MKPEEKKIFIGSDHRGFPLKEQIKHFLSESGIDIEDVGTFSDKPVDYPEYAKKVAYPISCNKYCRGLLICGSGIGMSIVANKFPGVRAALCHDEHTAKLSRQHNDANILAMGCNTNSELAKKMLTIWLKTPFDGGRHQRRIEQIRQIEREQFKVPV